jgi:hypothetical protein
MPWLSIIILPNVFLIPIDLSIPNVVFDLVRILAIKRITLGVEVIQAAPQTPDVNLFGEHVLLAMLKDLRS